MRVRGNNIDYYKDSELIADEKRIEIIKVWITENAQVLCISHRIHSILICLNKLNNNNDIHVFHPTLIQKQLASARN